MAMRAWEQETPTKFINIIYFCVCVFRILNVIKVALEEYGCHNMNITEAEENTVKKSQYF